MSYRALLICLVLVVTGCSAGGEYKLLDQSAPLKASYESVKLVITPTAENSDQIVQDLRASISGQLLSSGQFHRIANADEPSDIAITINVIKYERVSTAERVFLGAAAGSNRINTSVSIVDGRTGAPIKSFEASGQSAAHPLSGEADFSDALREVSKQIVLGLSNDKDAKQP